MRWIHKFILSWNSTCFEQFVCPSSWVYSLYTQQLYMSYRFVDKFQGGPSWSCLTAVYKPVLLSVQWINSWWWTDELSETCRFSWQNKFVKLVHLVGFITKKFVTMHGHMNVTYLVIDRIFLKVTSLSLGSLIVCWLIMLTYCLLVTCLDVCCLTVLKHFMLLNWIDVLCAGCLC